MVGTRVSAARMTGEAATRASAMRVFRMSQSPEQAGSTGMRPFRLAMLRARPALRNDRSRCGRRVERRPAGRSCPVVRSGPFRFQAWTPEQFRGGKDMRATRYSLIAVFGIVLLLPSKPVVTAPAPPQSPPTYQQFLSPASPLEVVAAKKVDRIAWVDFEEGKR